MITKEIAIIVDKMRVGGLLDATPECLTVHISSPFGNLKTSERLSGCPVGSRRFAGNGKLNKETIARGEEILRGLYLVGKTLRREPEIGRRLRKYVARYTQKALLIQRERQHALVNFNGGKVTKEAHASRMADLQIAENQNIIERGVVFRRCAEQLAQQTGGRADIESILNFTT